MSRFDYARLKAWPFEDVVSAYGPKDTIRYALALGAGRDPLDARALRYVYEKGLVALPTMAVTLGYPGSWMAHPDINEAVSGLIRTTLNAGAPDNVTVVIAQARRAAASSAGASNQPAAVP